MKYFNIIFATLFTLVIAPAHAYLDPGTGSMTISVIIALFATLVYMCKDWFYSLKKKLKNKK